MSTITVNHIAKALGSTQAVRDVSFEVLPGEIFGLLGPNGAGKTTSIRMILDIFKPDHGTISVFGAVAGQISANRDRIGYLPEERGLYKDARLEDCVLYLAELKGVARSEAKLRALRYFEQFDLMPHRKKKISELSKGMQQKLHLYRHQKGLEVQYQSYKEGGGQCRGSGSFPIPSTLHILKVRDLIMELGFDF